MTTTATSARRAPREEPEALVWATVAVGLLAGVLFMRATTDRTTTLDSRGGAALSIPVTWGRDAVDGTLLGARDLQAGSFGPRVSLRVLPLPRAANESLTTSVSNWSLIRGERLEGYRVLGIERAEIRVNGTPQPAMNLTFAYLQDAPGANLPPAVMLQEDVITAWKGRLYAVSFTAERDEYPRLDSLRARLTANVRLP